MRPWRVSGSRRGGPALSGWGYPPGGAVPGQPAGAQPFVEAHEPAEVAALGEIDMPRMHRPLHGRLPAQREAVIASLPEPHAARGQDVDAQAAVVQLDEVDAVA